MPDRFSRLAQRTAEAVGSPWAFLIGVAITVLWACLGPVFNYSDTWQLIINTGTTIATFLIVFLIQHTQNRDGRVMQLKLDELIRAIGSARTELVSMEGLSDQELEALHQEFLRLQQHAIAGLERIQASRTRKAPVRSNERPSRTP